MNHAQTALVWAAVAQWLSRRCCPPNPHVAPPSPLTPSHIRLSLLLCRESPAACLPAPATDYNKPASSICQSEVFGAYYTQPYDDIITDDHELSGVVSAYMGCKDRLTLGGMCSYTCYGERSRDVQRCSEARAPCHHPIVYLTYNL